MMPSKPVETFATLPDPGTARTLDELVERLRSLKIWAGDLSYEVITDRVNDAWVVAGRPAGELARRGTVVDCFKLGRRRLNNDLAIAVVRALHPDEGYVAQWAQALRVVLGEAQAAVQVRAQDRLPDDLVDFTGRSTDLDRLRHALRRGHEVGHEAGHAVVISAIEGMAGVGKTQLAVHAGHVLAAEQPFDHVLFVNLRGFHPDPAQPPADPAAALDSFLRLLGVSGQQIPHDLAARAALYRHRLADKRALVVLDNAADEEQVAPLLPDGPDCLTLVTSRRSLTGLRPAIHLAVDVFTLDEAHDYLKRAVSEVPVGEDPGAVARIAQRCGYLPLALGLLAGQMRTTPGWTVTDHADRLDERHRARRLDSGVELALSLSYQHLPSERQRLLRLLALHPGHDFDAYATAALGDIDVPTAEKHLRQLCHEHVLQQAGASRYTLHDLVRAYAADRARDEDRPPDRRAALTRLFDQYLYAAATAMNTMHPAERNRRLRIPPPATAMPEVAEPAAAGAWLDAERTNLMGTAAYAATRGWPEYTIRLATILYRYLDSSNHYTDAVVLHTHAARAAHHSGDPDAEAHALIDLGTAYWRSERYQSAAEHYQQALSLVRAIGDRLGEARTLTNLGLVHWSLGEYRQAVDLHQRSVTMFREIGDRSGEARALDNLSVVYERLGRIRSAAEQYQQSLALFREIGDRSGEASAHLGFGEVCLRLDQHQQATDSYRRSLALFREIGNRSGEAAALMGVGRVHGRLGRHRRAIDHLQQALAICRAVDDRGVEADACNSLGETLLADGQPDRARSQHAAALSLADQIGDPFERARAHDGLAHTFHATGNTDQARHHWQQALTVYAELDVPEADRVRAHLAA